MSLRALWRWSWVVTLPISVAFVWWAARTAMSYHTFGVRYDTAPLPYTLSDAADAHLGELAKRIELSFTAPFRRNRTARSDDLRTVHLFAEQGELARLDGNLPHSGFDFVKGGIAERLADGSAHMVRGRLRYRGDFVAHWGYPKKSWRVKTRAGSMWEDLRTLNLQAPKFPSQLNNYVGYALARVMGLIVPRSELVQVALNGEPMGVHLLVEQLEELTLRTAGSMPGDMYSGELMAKDEQVGIVNEVFRHPGLWTKVSVNNHYPADSKVALDKLIRLVQAEPSEQVHAELSAMLDLEAWGRFSAFETLIQSWHYDDHHNWRLFWDSNRGKMVPVVWDPIALCPGMFVPGDTVIDVIASKLHLVLFQNGDFLRARQRAFEQFFAAGLDRRYLAIYDDVHQALRRALAVDPVTRPTDRGTIYAAIDEFRGKIEQVLRDVRREAIGDEGRIRWTPLPTEPGIAVELRGRVPVSSLTLRLTRPAQQTPTAARVRCYDRDGGAHDYDVSGAVSVRTGDITVDLGLLPRMLAYSGAPRGDVLRGHRKMVAHAYYELVLEADLLGNPVREVLAARGSRTDLLAERVADLERLTCDETTYRSVVERPMRQTLVIDGDFHVAGNLELHDDVLIRPGTTFHMAPRANVRFWGRVMALGNRDQPIRFQPRDDGQEPWGVIALQGRGCDGSRFVHCHFAAGSGWKEPLWEYSAMFNLHDCRDVEARFCHFRDSQVVDDMVHAIYADTRFVDCLFERSLADAFDMDICTGSVERCTFVGSGNDALDLMTCRVTVVETLLEESGDKGISVGENTTLLAVGNRFVRCNIGMQGKDSSRAWVYNCEFDDNNTAIDCYKKNWRYNDGGHVSVFKSRFVNSRRTLTADAHSDIAVSDSFVDFAIPQNPRVVVDELCDGDEPTTPQRDHRLPLPEGLDAMADEAQRFFLRVATHRRGPAPAQR